MAISSDGSRILSAVKERSDEELAQLKVWDTETKQEILSVKIDERNVVAFSADGERIAFGGADGRVRVLDARTGHELLTLETVPVGSLAFSDDGTRLGTVSHDGSGRIWDAIRGQFLDAFEGVDDVAAVVAKSAFFPQCVQRGHGLDTIIEEPDTRRPIAWLPFVFTLDHITAHSLSRTVVGVVSEYLCLFTLEGEPEGIGAPSVTPDR